MAINVLSVNSVTLATASTVVIPAPTGIFVGALLVAQIAFPDTTTSVTLSGWTSIRSDTDSTTNVSVQATSVLLYKVADSGDVSASSFTFTLGASKYSGGGMLCIQEGNIGNSFSAAALNTGTGTALQIANTITPVANSLIIIAVCEANPTSNSSYGITTSSPSFTEAWDFNGNGGGPNGGAFALAYGVRAAATATGNSTLTSSADTSGIGVIGQQLGIGPAVAANVSDTGTSTDGVSAVRTRVFTASETVTNTDTTVTVKSRNWSKDSKNTTTWTNTQKS